MKKIALALIGMVATGAISCSKSDTVDKGGTDFNTLKNTFITDFVNKTAITGYNDLAQRSATFNDKVTIFKGAPTEENLAAAKQAWRDMRSTWEQCEGFLFGPVEDDNLDPGMDTWPVDRVQLDSVISSSNPLEITDIQGLALSLRGYHPIEYILWGADGKRKAADINAREMKYITSLTLDLKNVCQQLSSSWIPSGGDYGSKLLTAGNGGILYHKKQDVYTAVVSAMASICEEVGNNKMKEPFDQRDGMKVESPFSGNSLTDFKNNLIGAYNVYTGNFLGNKGVGLDQVVAAKNTSLDKDLQEKFQAAINSFNAITVPYEVAIGSQRTQCAQVMTAINELQGVLNTQLKKFVVDNITD
ncbi:putative iron-regulated protein [Chitinophaga niastensis]|uniref:Putative iron-regulated protein n=1 Tax=Chitinophaga niastensis TaxID=536980 RepID=A0A2P8HKN6_CHINA|nr:imelysin family protein [Chitinophaga niastensis]PSL46730.1 putative iron-regulated protein [Chitinophaga niastensis]